MMDLDKEEQNNETKAKLDLIEEISTKYVETFPLQPNGHFQLDVTDRNSALISWTRSANEIGVGMIYFLRQIEDFETLHFDDRFHLIKWNLFLLFPLLKSYYYQSSMDCCTHNESEEAQNHRRFFLLYGDYLQMREEFARLIVSLVQITEQNPRILSLLSLILIFSKGFSPMNEDILYLNSSRIDQLQAFYLELLSIYLIDRYGEAATSKFFIQILQNLFRIQSSVFQFKNFFHQQVSTLDSTESVTPLLQTILNIS